MKSSAAKAAVKSASAKRNSLFVKRRAEEGSSGFPAGLRQIGKGISGSGRSGRGIPGALFVLFGLILSLSACRSIPVPQTEEHPDLLYREGSILLVLKIDGHEALSEEILTKFLPGDTAKRLLSRSDVITLRVFEDEEGHIRFEGLARGRYPGRIIAAALKKDGWEKRSTPLTWYEYPPQTLQLAVPDSRLLVAANADMPGLLNAIMEEKTRTVVPAETAAVMERSALTLYGRYPKFSSYFDQRIAGLLPRVEEFRMSLSGEDEYRLDGMYRFSDEKTARSFFLALRLALLRRAREEGKRAIMEIVENRYVQQSEEMVTVKGARIDTEEFILLLGIFSPAFFGTAY